MLIISRFYFLLISFICIAITILSESDSLDWSPLKNIFILKALNYSDWKSLIVNKNVPFQSSSQFKRKLDCYDLEGIISTRY